MNNIILRSIAIVVLCVSLGACSSTIAKSAQRSDGLLDFVAGNSSEVAVPVEKVSGGGGRIASAHVRANGKNVYVSGLVQRQSVGNPPPWAHVDVIVLDSRQRVVETTSTNYLPRDIPHGLRGGFPQSRYIARLAALPAAGSTIKVVFHSAHRDECEFARKS